VVFLHALLVVEEVLVTQKCVHVVKCEAVGVASNVVFILTHNYIK